MLTVLLAALAVFPVAQSPAQTPPRPTDAQLLTNLIAARPLAEVLNHAGRDMTDNDGRLVCGVARIEGRIEPFVAYALWTQDRWISGDAAPGRAHGANATAWDASARKQALTACPELSPPEGAIWDTDVPLVSPPLT